MAGSLGCSNSAIFSMPIFCITRSDGVLILAVKEYNVVMPCIIASLNTSYAASVA